MTAQSAANATVAAMRRAVDGVPPLAEGTVVTSTLSRGGWEVVVSCPDIGDVLVPQSVWCGAFSTAVRVAVAAVPAGTSYTGLLDGWRVLMGFPAGRPHILDVVGVN